MVQCAIDGALFWCTLLSWCTRNGTVRHENGVLHLRWCTPWKTGNIKRLTLKAEVGPTYVCFPNLSPVCPNLSPSRDKFGVHQKKLLANQFGNVPQMKTKIYNFVPRWRLCAPKWRALKRTNWPKILRSRRNIRRNIRKNIRPYILCMYFLTQCSLSTSNLVSWKTSC